jgi:uncharacterized protein with GYD domain
LIINIRRNAMSLFLARPRYTADAYKGMIAKPEDRAAPVKALFEAAGAKLLHMWFSPSTLEAIMIVEGDTVARTTVEMVVMASGAIADLSTIELITTQQQLDAMKAAAAVAAKYRGPGK